MCISIFVNTDFKQDIKTPQSNYFITFKDLKSYYLISYLYGSNIYFEFQTDGNLEV